MPMGGKQRRRLAMVARIRPGDLFWLVAWAAVTVAVVGGMLRARRWTLEHLAGPEQQAHWDEFRREMARHDGHEGPVQRRVPKSAEPPALVLLRDHFAVSLFGAVFFSTLLFAATAFVVRGALSSLWQSDRSREPTGRPQG